MRVRFTTRAVAGVEQAVDHYAGGAAELAVGFLEQVDRVLERLQMFPAGAPPVDGYPGVRRARIRRFPYGVFYRVDDDDLIVLRVLRSRRDSGEALGD